MSKLPGSQVVCTNHPHPDDTLGYIANSNQTVSPNEFRLGDYRTHCPTFARDVLAKLRSLSKADRVGLLILGPTGSGKSHLAKTFHSVSRRSRNAFVTLDCAQVTSDLTLAAELFGYAPRSGFANTPAGGSLGAAKKADGGTLFIDEIACLSLPLQQKLLALVQEGTFSPLGSSDSTKVDIQIIAATHENMEDLVRQGRFRQDLYWRLSDVTLTMPSLSRRAADIPHFAQSFLEAARQRYNLPEIRGFGESALRALLRHDWSRSGNIRGLERAVYRSLLLVPHGTVHIEADHLHFPALLGDDEPVMEAANRSERSAVGEARRPPPDIATLKAAIREHGSGSAAARALGITRGVLVWHLRKLGLTIQEVRGPSPPSVDLNSSQTERAASNE